MSAGEILNCIYNIEEEDLLIDESSLAERNFVKIYEGEYIDTRIDIVFYQNKVLFEQEIENRIKQNNKFLPVILGKSKNTCLKINDFFNYCLVLEKPNYLNLSDTIKKNILSTNEILNLIKNLIHFYDFFNTRNHFFGILSLEEILYDKKTQDIKVVKYPLDISSYNISNEDHLKNYIDKERLILLAPEIIKGIKTQQHFELNSITESWNLGMLVYQILENNTFFEINESSKDFTLEIIMNIDNQTITEKINSLNHNQIIKNLLKKLLKSDKKQRLCTKLLKQTFLKRINFNDNNNKNYNYNNLNSFNNKNPISSEGIPPKQIESKFI